MSVYRGANLAWHLAGDADLLEDLADGADLLVLLECRDKQNRPINVRALLGRDWRVWQDLRDASRAGTAIAVRRRTAGGRIRPRRVAGAFSTMLRIAVPGRRVQARYLRELKIRDPDLPGRRKHATIAGAHIPLESTGQQDDAIRALARWWDRTPGRRKALGDGNTSHERLRQLVGAAHSFGRDVMFDLWSTGWADVDTHGRRTEHTDHHVLTSRT